MDCPKCKKGNVSGADNCEHLRFAGVFGSMLAWHWVLDSYNFQVRGTGPVRDHVQLVGSIASRMAL